MWNLSSNIYLVNGAVNAAIYDLVTGNLYQINEEAKILLNDVINNSKNIFSDEEAKYLNELSRLGIMTQEEVGHHEIQELCNETKIEFAWIEVTDMCNLKCIHCYDDALCGKGKIMSLSDFCHIIDELQKNNIRKIQLIGGEPFVLNDSIFDYLNYCIGKFDYIEIFTNGTLIKDQWLSYFKENNIRIALSVYSYDENIHNYVTKNDLSWKKTNESIAKLKEMGITYRVKNVLMKDVTIGEKNTDLYELSKKKDIVRLTGRADLNLLTDELIQRKLITEENFAYKISKKLVEKCLSGHNCFSRRLYFSVNLDVFPCVMERRFIHGNIKEHELAKILDRSIFKLTKDAINECKECELRYCCFDCRPDSGGRGKYDKPWYCTYDPLQGKWCDMEAFIKKLRQNQ